jgi:hypothetical protein
MNPYELEYRTFSNYFKKIWKVLNYASRHNFTAGIRNIQFIVMQDYTNLHIVVIDGASVDSTGVLIKKYQ